jgi:hypothetical protein
MPNEQIPNMDELFKKVDSVLTKVDLSKTTSENIGFEDLKSGYYLCEVESAKLTESKKSHNPQIALTLKTIDDGFMIDDDDNRVVYTGSKNRKIFKYYPLIDETSVKRFVSDMLKFEDDDGNSILPQEAFTTAETLTDSLEVIEGMRIYIQLTVSGEGEAKNNWTSLLSWKRVAQLEIADE